MFMTSKRMWKYCCLVERERGGGKLYLCYKWIFVYGNISQRCVSISNAFVTVQRLFLGSSIAGFPPMLCVRGHRDTVTRHLYLDQSLIPLQRLFCCMFIIFPGWYKAFCARWLPVSRSQSIPPGDHLIPRGFRSWSGLQITHLGHLSG